MIRQLRADGWECHVAIGSPPRLAGEYAAAGAVLHVVPMERLTTSGGWRRWVRFALAWPTSVVRLILLGRRLGVGVVHTNTLHNWCGWAVALVLRRPHVWHAREIVVQSALALRVERLLARWFATRVVAISGAVAAQFADFPPGRVVVVFDEVDPSEFGPGLAGRWRRRAGIADDALVVGSVGRIDTWKGVDVFLDAVPLVRAGGSGGGGGRAVEVVVAGPAVDGKEPYAAELSQRAAALGVHWLGRRDDVPELLADLDVYVMASTEPEPFGLGLVEALASGVPSVATDAGGPAEILGPLVGGGRNGAGGGGVGAGLLVPAGDPTALADAVLALLPPATDAASRAARRPLRTAPAGRFDELFSELVGPE